MSKFDKLIERISTIQKMLEDASFDELDKILSKLGYEKNNSSGSHFVYRKSGRESLTLPKCKPMKECYAKMVLEIYFNERG